VTMIDEEVLGDALRKAAESIHPSEDAMGRILAEAFPASATPGPEDGRGARPRYARRRIVLVAAAVALIAGAATASVETMSTGNSSSPGAASQAALPTGLPASHRSASSGSLSASGSSGAPVALGTSGQAGSTAAPGEFQSSSSQKSSPASAIPSGSVGQSAKIESNGSVALNIGKGTLQTVIGQLTALAAAEGGFVANTQAQLASGGAGASGTIVLQVPQANFGTVVIQVQRIGHPTSVTTTSQDVTGQYVNLQARITALESSRQQYLTIMTRASSIGDILAVQSQLDTLQSEIDQLQGQVNVLVGETTYGTLTVSLTEPGKSAPPAPRPKPAGSGLAKAWDKSVGGFVSGIEWIVRILGPLLLILLCVAGLLLLGRFLWRFGRRRMI
jgi:hypothetical protein